MLSVAVHLKTVGINFHLISAFIAENFEVSAADIFDPNNLAANNFRICHLQVEKLELGHETVFRYIQIQCIGTNFA